jgi:hypothetical protein
MNMGAAENESLRRAAESDSPCAEVQQGAKLDGDQGRRTIEALGPLLLDEVKARTKRKEERRLETDGVAGNPGASVDPPSGGPKRKRKSRKVVVSDSEGEENFDASGETSRGCASLSGAVRRLRGGGENESESESGDGVGFKRQKSTEGGEEGVGKEKILEMSDAATAGLDGPQETEVRGEDRPAERRKSEEAECPNTERIELPREIGDQPTMESDVSRKRPWEESRERHAAEEPGDGKWACVREAEVTSRTGNSIEGLERTEGQEPRGLGLEAENDIDREAWTDPELDELLDQHAGASEVTVREGNVSVEDGLVGAGEEDCANNDQGKKFGNADDLEVEVQGTGYPRTKVDEYATGWSSAPGWGEPTRGPEENRDDLEMNGQGNGWSSSSGRGQPAGADGWWSGESGVTSEGRQKVTAIPKNVRVMNEREEAARVYKPRPRQRFSLRDLKEVNEMVETGVWNLEREAKESTKEICLDEDQNEERKEKVSSPKKESLEQVDNNWWGNVKKSLVAQRAVVEAFQVRLHHLAAKRLSSLPLCWSETGDRNHT